MADLGNMNVRIGADLSELISKVDAAKAKLNELTESQGKLKAGINDLNASLKLNEAELGKTATQLKKLVDSGKGATAEANNLRKAISGLSANSAQLNTSLNTAKTQLAATTTQIKTQTVALKQAETATGGFAKGATKLYSGLRTLANIIPGIGIGGLVAVISGPLVDAFQEWYQTINKVSEATKILKANQSDLNDIMADANKDAGKQIADLQILYQAATNVNLSLKDRLTAVDALQAKFPAYFKNISDETILNGGAEKQYLALSASIRETARAKASVAKLQEIEAQQLDNDFKRKKVLIATENELLAARKRGDIFLKGQIGTAHGTVTVKETEEAILKRRKAANDDLDISDRILKGRREFLTNFIGLSQLAAAVETTIKPIKEPKDIKVKVKEIKERILQEIKNIEIPLEDIFKTSKKKIDPIGQIFPTDKIRKASMDIEELNAKLQEAGEFATSVLTPAFDALFTSIVEGSGSAFQSFGEALNKVIKQLVVTVLKAVALGAILALIKGTPFNLGSIITGALKGFAEGGEVKGPGSGKSDSILARVSAGEYIMKADAVKRITVPVLNKLNQGGGFDQFIKGGFPKFANGGFISPNLLALAQSNLSGSIGGGQSIQVEVFGRLKGNDIYVANQRTSITRGRNS